MRATFEAKAAHPKAPEAAGQVKTQFDTAMAGIATQLAAMHAASLELSTAITAAEARDKPPPVQPLPVAASGIAVSELGTNVGGASSRAPAAGTAVAAAGARAATPASMVVDAVTLADAKQRRPVEELLLRPSKVAKN